MRLAKISSKDIHNVMRMDGSFHLSEGNLIEKTILKNEYKFLENFCDNIFTSGRSKRFYTSKENGYPYLSNSDVIAQNPFASCKYNSKKYAFDNHALLKKGMILTGRVGAIGQTAYVTDEFEEKMAMGSDNIIRIVPKKNEYGGFLYTYLTSEIGNKLLWKLATGGVQPYITDSMLAHIPVPIFPKEKQEQIHNLITEAATLRVEANRLLEEAHVTISNKLSFLQKKASFSAISSSQIRDSFSSRFEASFFNCEGAEIEKKIKDNFTYKLLNEVSENIFRPGIFKRNYISKGINFLGGSDIIKAIPKSDKYLSLTKTKNIKELIIEKGWILVTCGGTIGNTVLVDKQLAECAISQHVLRIIPKDIYGGYLFAILSSSTGFELINKYVYGSVIPQIEPQHIGLIPIPLLEDEVMKEIDRNITLYANKLEKAKFNETQAISLVENEIALWQS